MEGLIQQLRSVEGFETKLSEFYRQNVLERPKMMSYSLQKILKLHDALVRKYRNMPEEVSEERERCWMESQLVLFKWAVAALCLCKKCLVENLKDDSMQKLSKIFRNKPMDIIAYELRVISTKGKQIRRQWKSEQDDLLIQIINSSFPAFNNRWNYIARELFRLSEGSYCRQGKHCRERWQKYLSAKNDKCFKDQQYQRQGIRQPNEQKEQEVKLEGHDAFQSNKDEQLNDSKMKRERTHKVENKQAVCDLQMMNQRAPNIADPQIHMPLMRNQFPLEQHMAFSSLNWSLQMRPVPELYHCTWNGVNSQGPVAYLNTYFWH